ncbi:MAG: biosynthetic arginine decarboxylase [Pseudomonadota bacterium]
MRAWTVKDSVELYSINNWGAGFFRVNEKGHVEVAPTGVAGPGIDLKVLTEDLEARGIQLPILLRFSGILRARVNTIQDAFSKAIGEYEYEGGYRPVYPIKVNQQRHLVEELVRYAEPLGMGLEAGSKPEVLLALSLLEQPGSLIICNGYKDEDYLEAALLAKKLGRKPIIVVEKFSEFEAILELAERLDMEPTLGVRMRPSSRGAGRWEGSSGDRSKFGLSAQEIVDGVALLKGRGMLHCLELLHFHIGSQVSAIRAFKSVLREAARMYVELHRLGARMGYLDVGGGLGVDYDGSRSNFPSSVNYSVEEYAADVVAAVESACEEHDVPHPTLVSESGRALVAHSSMLVFNVMGVASPLAGTEDKIELAADEHELMVEMIEVRDDVSRKTYQESWHDALELREETLSRFELGLLDLPQRARIERVFWQVLARILTVVRSLDYVPDDLEGLEKHLADVYYCNFSVFQSAPDSWAVGQLFPVVPIHRLKEKPVRRGILADITCDSDGKLDRFIDLRDVRDVLPLHPLGDDPYYLGVFLVGAYQEILGDLHNLFGDTNAVHVSLGEDGSYCIDHVLEGDTVTEVLTYVGYSRAELVTQVRLACEQALRRGDLTLKDSRRLLRAFRNGLDGYTYLE